jgi:hypothetical protein
MTLEAALTGDRLVIALFEKQGDGSPRLDAAFRQVEAECGGSVVAVRCHSVERWGEHVQAPVEWPALVAFFHGERVSVVPSSDPQYPVSGLIANAILVWIEAVKEDLRAAGKTVPDSIPMALESAATTDFLSWGSRIRTWTN